VLRGVCGGTTPCISRATCVCTTNVRTVEHGRLRVATAHCTGGRVLSRHAAAPIADEAQQQIRSTKESQHVFQAVSSFKATVGVRIIDLRLAWTVVDLLYHV
jgi:hypothetical protein